MVTIICVTWGGSFVTALLQKFCILVFGIVKIILCHGDGSFVTIYFRSFMTRSSTNYCTAVVAPTAGDSIREAHSYEYDNNGNIVYVNTSRVKPDMTAQSDTVQRGREERFRWDEENRLTALSQNGYVSHYWYDADGERDKRTVPVSHF